MDFGLQAYNEGSYVQAVQAFQFAVTADPRSEKARLSLGYALAMQFKPGTTDPDSLKIAERADAAFRSVLEVNPNNRTALASLGALDATLRKFDESKSWYGRLLQVDPANSEAFYGLGVIAWKQAFAPIQDARRNLNMNASENGLSDANVRSTFRQKYGPVIADGIASLMSAMRVNPNYVDALAVLVLLYSLQAELEDTASAAAQDIEKAEEFGKQAAKLRGSGTSTGPAPTFPLQRPVSIAPMTLPPPKPLPQRIRFANLTHRVEPIYPPLARQARIQGTVRFTVTVAKDGTVSNIQLLSGHPLLVAAAQEAVRQWQYTPTLLNGQPVEVVIPADVTFTLPQ
jgi:TonB family protein